MLEMHLVSPYRMSPLGCTHVSNDDYKKVCQLYEAARLKLAEARLSDKHISRVDMVPPVGRGRGIRCGERAGRRARCQPAIVEET
ncbi:hypothetical protein JCGZ_13623 [Jatropha curcas]|uniref:Uncharacterized protein n=1 Tax=Jatropha curcas TaxID=180498 RepID=A0A067KA81_JATCU|nr:hypothetical protein JCGZ_13623 [Jatropha curcas]